MVKSKGPKGSEELIRTFLEWYGIRELYPPQSMAWNHIFGSKNLVVSAPTASGKTLIAYIAALRAVLEGGKCVYTVPLKALAMEKYNELRSMLPKFRDYVYERGVNIHPRLAVSMGNYDSAEESLATYDIVICTSEKLDSLLRHMPKWIHDISVVVVDEIHMIGEGRRGPTLEMVITRLRTIRDDIQIIGLSATISNAREIAEWLDAELIYSEWRPVELRAGVCVEGTVFYEDGSKNVLDEIELPVRMKSENMRSVALMLADIIAQGGQMLVFVSSRRNAELYADQLADVCINLLDTKSIKSLEHLAKRVCKSGGESEFASETYTQRVRNLIQSGVCFHHAGLTHELRTGVEEAFIKGHLKCIVATPTLAAGVNLPSRRVAIAHYTRYEPGLGQVPLKAMEIKQMLGRAGRPKYDPYGEGIIVARTYSEIEDLMDVYIRGESESVDSMLSSEVAMRMHILALAAWFPGGMSGEEIENVMRRTYFHKQHGLGELRKRLGETLNFLIFEGFLNKSSDIIGVTRIGARVNEMYVDPYSAARMILGVRVIDTLPQGHRERPLPYLFALSASSELPILPCRDREYVEYVNALNDIDIDALSTLSAAYHIQDRVWRDLMDIKKTEGILEVREAIREDMVHTALEAMGDIDALGRSGIYASMLKSALVYASWIDEWDPDRIHKVHGVAPGDLSRRVEMGEWLLYSAQRLCEALAMDTMASKMNKLMERVRHGIREDAIGIVGLEGVGRKRARTLLNSGYRSVEDLRNTTPGEIAKLPGFGRKLAANIIRQAGGRVEETPKPAGRKKKGPTKIEDFGD